LEVLFIRRYRRREELNVQAEHMKGMVQVLVTLMKGRSKVLDADSATDEGADALGQTAEFQERTSSDHKE